MDRVTVGFPCALVGEGGENEGQGVELQIVLKWTGDGWDFDEAYFEHPNLKGDRLEFSQVPIALFNYLIDDDTWQAILAWADDEALAGNVR